MAGYHKWQELLTLREHLGSPPVFGGSLLNFFLFSVLCCVYVVFLEFAFNLCSVPYPWLKSVLSNVYLYVLNSHAVTKQLLIQTDSDGRKTSGAKVDTAEEECKEKKLPIIFENI